MDAVGDCVKQSMRPVSSRRLRGKDQLHKRGTLESLLIGKGRSTCLLSPAALQERNGETT
jgi:hypothetical protein